MAFTAEQSQIFGQQFYMFLKLFSISHIYIGRSRSHDQAAAMPIYGKNLSKYSSSERVGRLQ